MKVSFNELQIGVEYWFDNTKYDRGVFVGTFENTLCFYPIGACGYPAFNDDGTVPFPLSHYRYEEV